MAAAYFRHSILKQEQILAPKNIFCRYYSIITQNKQGRDKKPDPKFQATAESLAAKGFLRAQKEYCPPSDTEQKLTEIFNNVLGHTKLDARIIDLKERSKLFIECWNKFQHGIPNSQLHQIETLKDVVTFYMTPIDIRTPLDKLKSMDLPKNIHIQQEYVRWHPETDTKFGGQTAFPESSTLVTGLKYKNKYKGHIQKRKFPQY